VLLTEDMVKSMRFGSVIVDMAVEQGGNCVGSEIHKTVVKHGVTLSASRICESAALNASDLYARNVAAFLTHLAERRL